MQVFINGKEEVITNAINITELLKEKKVQSPEMVAVELNNVILDRAEFENTHLQENDKLEFLYFMGGGSKNS